VIESVDLSASAASDAPSAAAADSDPAAADPTAAPAPPFSRHVLERTIVLPDLRVLFVPVPKAGCTTVLWRLAELAGIPLETFAQSALPEVSPALTIHDMSLWGEEFRLANYEGVKRERILTEDGWFRFSTVRHPGTRLWSAWQSKLLLREPRFVEMFGDEPWFPRVPERPADLLEDFHRFVAALPAGKAEDVHWAVQHDLVAQLPLNHVGRVERLPETLALLREHVSGDRWPAATPRQNRAPLPVPSGVYDEAAAAVLHDRYRPDFDHFGYEGESVDGEMSAGDWEKHVAPLIPMIRDTIDRHARIGELHHVARYVRTAEKKVETVSTQQAGRSKTPVLTNLEGYTEFNVRWSWADGKVEPGVTAVIRIKNEAQSLPWVLPPLLRAVSHVVIVDNGSTDGSVDVARRVASDAGASDRLELHTYPFSVARCGQEHLDMPAGSVHSLAYFYNWSFAHVRTGYALKWDGDMVLTDTAVNALRDLAWQLEASESVVKIPRYPLYIASERRAYLDVEWELPLWPGDYETVILPAWACVELKYLDADEFGHWSDTQFDATSRTRRKLREWTAFQTLAEGGEPPADVVPIESPDDRHVIDYVCSTWLPEKAAEWSDRRRRSALGQVTA
jgi:Sulfotransferase family